MGIQSSLKQARVRAGLSLTDAAKQSGIQRSNIAAIENGRRDPTASTIEKIASASRVRLIPVKTDGRTSVAEASIALADAVRQDNTRRAYRVLVQVADDLTTRTRRTASSSPSSRPPTSVPSGTQLLLASPNGGSAKHVCRFPAGSRMSAETRIGDGRLPYPLPLKRSRSVSRTCQSRCANVACSSKQTS